MLPNLQQVWLYSPNLQQVWLFLPHLQQVWLTQDQLGAFLAVLSAALYLPYKTRTYKALCVARKTAVFIAPKPLPLTPSARSLCLYGPCVYSPRRLVSGIRHDQEVRPTRGLHTPTRSKQRDLNYLKPTRAQPHSAQSLILTTRKIMRSSLVHHKNRSRRHRRGLV